MKALSIQQPWAWSIINGFKDIENRNWKPTNPGLKFRGPFLIHTGLKFDMSFCPDLLPKDIPWPPYPSLTLGGIVGYGEIVDVVTESESPWFFGPFGLVIRNARPLPFLPLKGQLGFFNADYPGIKF